MSNILIDTKKKIFELDGKPINNCTELTLHINPNGYSNVEIKKEYPIELLGGPKSNDNNRSS